MKTAVARAPGKVLLAGGYLVLDERERGWVVACPAAVTVTVELVATAAPISVGAIEAKVECPQFTDAVWTFGMRNANEALVQNSGSKNPFVLAALELAVLESGPIGDGVTFRATVQADNEFYSQTAQLRARGLEASLAGRAALPPHVPLGVPLANVAKTGLGSSAALTTALVAAVLAFLTQQPPELDRVLATSQLAHCLAQGKVGSGFDVAAAVFGSQIYQRFPRALVDEVAAQRAAGALSQEILRGAVADCRWKPVGGMRALLELPPGLVVILGDVRAGSSTTKLVAQVNEWRARDAASANAIFAALHVANENAIRAAEILREQHQEQPGIYQAALDAAANGLVPTDSPLGALSTAFVDIRCAFQRLSAQSGVPVEPASQTPLLDATAGVSGVLGVGIPGAGGGDALFCVCIDTIGVIAAVEALWASSGSVEALLKIDSHAHPSLCVSF